MAGLGARLAGARYLGVKLDRDQHAGQLKAAIGGLKGPLMKVAQIHLTSWHHLNHGRTGGDAATRSSWP